MGEKGAAERADAAVERGAGDAERGREPAGRGRADSEADPPLAAAKAAECLADGDPALRGCDRIGPLPLEGDQAVGLAHAIGGRDPVPLREHGLDLRGAVVEEGALAPRPRGDHGCPVAQDDVGEGPEGSAGGVVPPKARQEIDEQILAEVVELARRQPERAAEAPRGGIGLLEKEMEV